MPQADQVRTMFDRISGRYDLMNRVMTLGIDVIWRRKTVAWAHDLVATNTHVSKMKALDVCCGTGDLTFALADSGIGEVTGIDFSEGMLQVARRRLADRSPTDARGTDIEFVGGDAMALPFPDDTFDIVTVGFGVRNVEDLDEAFREMLRVAKPGGVVCCLEATRPTNRAAAWFYRFWFDQVVPTVGGIIAGDRSAYRYLPESTKKFPKPQALVDRLVYCGFEQVKWRTFSGGVVGLHAATKGQERIADSRSKEALVTS